MLQIPVWGQSTIICFRFMHVRVQSKKYKAHILKHIRHVYEGCLFFVAVIMYMLCATMVMMTDD